MARWQLERCLGVCSLGAPLSCFPSHIGPSGLAEDHAFCVTPTSPCRSNKPCLALAKSRGGVDRNSVILQRRCTSLARMRRSGRELGAAPRCQSPLLCTSVPSASSLSRIWCTVAERGEPRGSAIHAWQDRPPRGEPPTFCPPSECSMPGARRGVGAANGASVLRSCRLGACIRVSHKVTGPISAPGTAG